MIYPGYYDGFTVIEGATFYQTFQLKDTHGALVNLTGAAVRSYMIKGNGEQMNFISALVDAVNGKVSVSISAALTASMSSRGTWYLFIDNADGTIDCWLTGPVSIVSTR